MAAVKQTGQCSHLYITQDFRPLNSVFSSKSVTYCNYNCPPSVEGDILYFHVATEQINAYNLR